MRVTVIVSLAVLGISDNAVGSDAEHADALVSWIRRENGFYNEKMKIRRANPNDLQSRFGIFATDKIDANEHLLTVPSGALIKSRSLKSKTKQENEGSDLHCDSVRSLAKEMRRKNESYYAPYLHFLSSDTQPITLPPSAWSEAGQDLFLKILGTDEDGDQILPPVEPVDWITEDWYEGCDGSDDPLEMYAVGLVAQAGWQAPIVPVLDMMRHRNGKWLNTHSVREIDGSSVRVHASRVIEAGEEMYTTYNLCEDCEAKGTNYGTPEIFREHGFVEEYPQMWFFDKVAFEIDAVYDANGVDTGETAFKNWIGSAPSDDAMEFLEDQLKRLVVIGEITLSPHDQNIEVPENEWDAIFEYHDNMVLAISLAIKQELEDLFGCLEEGTCDALSDRYIDLEDEPNGIDPDEYKGYPCDIDKQFEPFSDGTYETLEEINSHYQHIYFFALMKETEEGAADRESEDMCLELDGIVQICETYRPHYHEMAVHYPARFLPIIRRVLWVGGGDSMLLHEVLKYPSLELVVGLELDQEVTRKSFKYFGTQPHYDNEKVEWWYGDACKSLLMLPKEYFGSFDMVLVDLSETVMSFTVTEGLDIMEALSLLLKPDGIFVKNELYYEKLSSMFQYTIQIHWYDNPVICSQAMSLGSNNIDFINRNLTYHDIDTLFLEHLDTIKDPLEVVHDYRKNKSSVQLCKDKQDDQHGDLTEQLSSPGILMIIEAEDATADLKATDAWKTSLIKALEKEGLTVVSTIVTESEVKGAVVVIILREGYVTAHSMPEQKYVAFDSHLWSGFEKHKDIKKTLLEVAGSSSRSSSSFRIIAGGMYGVNSWRDDQKLCGPRFTKLCEQHDLSHEALVQQSPIDIILEEMVDLVEDDTKLVAVLCGEQTSACRSVDVLQEHKNVGNVLKLSCQEPKDINECVEYSTERMVACEQHVLNTMNAAVVGEKKLSAIIVDSSANVAIGEVMLAIFNSKTRQRELLMPNWFVMSSKLDQSENWQGHFVRRVLEDIFDREPVFNSKILFNGQDASLEVDITSIGDGKFIQKVNTVLQEIETKSGLMSEVQDVTAGLWVYEPDFKPLHVYTSQHYNQSSPFEQWMSQKPLGYQNVYQLENKSKNLSTPLIRGALEGILSNMFPIDEESDKNPELQEFSDFGIGCVLVAIWSGGSVIVMWDGNIHIDINLFMYDENEDRAEDFKRDFMAKFPATTNVLHDEYPRGIGRVVNFLEDVGPRGKPYWV